MSRISRQLEQAATVAGEKFPMGAMASFRFDGAWTAFEPHRAVLGFS
jgi:hypothetical protein